MNVIQEKIQRNSKRMSVVLFVLSIALIIGLIIPVAILIWVEVNADANLLVTNGWGIYSTAGKALQSIGEVKAEMCTVIAAGLLILVMFIKAYSMFRSISIDLAPFSKANATRLKQIGIILILYAIVIPIIRLGFYRSFAPEINMSSSIDAPYVVLSLIFFFIAMLFDYGAELQRESDELL
jgi:hypothetical protein